MHETILGEGYRLPDTTVTTVAPKKKKNVDDLMALVMRVQLALYKKGYDVGAIDGIMGTKTSKALRSYQGVNRLAVTGTMTTETLSRLGISFQ